MFFEHCYDIVRAVLTLFDLPDVGNMTGDGGLNTCDSLTCQRTLYVYFGQMCLVRLVLIYFLRS